MRVAVDHDGAGVFGEYLRHGIGRDIHDVHGFFAIVFAAAFAQAVDDGLALRQRHGQELFLPGGLAHHGAKLHVLHVFRAFGVAMQQDDAPAGNGGHVRFAEQGGASGGGKAGADKKVAVAGDPVDVHASIADGADGGRHARIERVFQIIVAGPVFEQVAQ
ncbi:hypothetical protein D3C72_1447170 [compost metagenome]